MAGRGSGHKAPAADHLSLKTNNLEPAGADDRGRLEDLSFLEQPDRLVRWQLTEQTFFFFAHNKVSLEITFLRSNLLKIKYRTASDRESRGLPYAVAPGLSWQPTPLEQEEELSLISIRTPSLICLVDKSDLRLKIYDRQSQQLVNEDALPFQSDRTIMKGKAGVKISKRAQPNECYFGLGDKSCSLNLQGQSLENWNTDAYGYGAETDPLYRSVPFYYGLHEGLAYGLFLNNSYRSTFDFNSKKDSRVTISAVGGQMEYFFIYGPQLDEVARSYHLVTGVPELPPLWALGYHQCRWSYFPEERVMEVAKDFRDRQIPCDAIYLDIDYMARYKCFTWDESLFPDPKGMIGSLSDQGFRTVVMIDPGIKIESGYWVFDGGMERNVFCRRSSGELMVGPVWPEDCVWPDFTNPAVREWWQGLYQQLYLEMGVSGFWNDMNEPAVFEVSSLTFPRDVLHHFDGRPTNHLEAHNIYGMQMSRATYEGLKMLHPEKRPFVLTRASFSGGQRYAAFWTGDNIASWEHLRLANIQSQRASISGFSFVGSDIGGFAERPDGELFVRWLQLGIFHPVFRTHSMGNHAGGAVLVDDEAVRLSETEARLDQEPWSFGEEYTPLARHAIEWRYRLLAYLYTCFWQHTTTGQPVLRSLVFAAQTDRNTYDREGEFLFGDHLLANPVQRRGAQQQETYLPAGKWYDFWTGETFSGPGLCRQSVTMATIPLFVRAGAVIPIWPVQQYTGELSPPTIGLEIFFTEGSTSSHFYDDAGEGYAHLEDGFKARTFTVKGTQSKLEVLQSTSGSFEPSYREFKLTITGLPFSATSGTVDGQLLELKETGKGDRTFSCLVSVNFQKVMLS